MARTRGMFFAKFSSPSNLGSCGDLLIAHDCFFTFFYLLYLVHFVEGKRKRASL